MPSKKTREPKKVTSEKPVSFYPLPFEEAVKDLFAVTPPKLTKKQKKSKSNQ